MVSVNWQYHKQITNLTNILNLIKLGKVILYLGTEKVLNFFEFLPLFIAADNYWPALIYKIPLNGEYLVRNCFADFFVNILILFLSFGLACIYPIAVFQWSRLY